MRLGRFLVGGESPRLGIIRDDLVYEIASEFGPALNDLFAAGSESIEEAGLRALDGEGRSLSEVRLLAPLVAPSKIICVGQNYPDHNQETAFVPPVEPLIFSKFA